MKPKPDSQPTEESSLWTMVSDPTKEVLIVDDDARVADVLRQLLEEEGFLVAQEGDGCAALMYIERQQPDVVLADMCMPRLGGLGLFHEIQRRWQDIDVILMSASESPTGLMVPFLKKPFDLEIVLNTIRNYPH